MSEQSFATPSLPFVRVETCDGIHAAVAFEVMRDHYGVYAATAAAWCAIEARGDGKDDHYRFWFGLFCDLRKASPVFSLQLPPAFKIPGISERSGIPSAENRCDCLSVLLKSRHVGDAIIREIRSIIKN